ncbi:MAG: ABC transporter ATP-binding protein, partial [Treponema sp.]|nr:ABC transporter ATP-binding protein [Treponema sp.]
MIDIQNLTKTFSTPRGKLTVLDNFSLKVQDGTFLGIAGKSGAGKSTLLSIIAGLQKPDSGKVIIGCTCGNANGTGDRDIFSLSEKELCLFRNTNIGFVSQEQSFLENLTVFDNVRLPYFIGLNKRTARVQLNLINARAKELLENLGIAHLSKSYPRDLSGGENHRLLIARALINNPDIILADEPTESVDSERTEDIVKIFRGLSDGGKTVILVSHDSQVLKSCDRIETIYNAGAQRKLRNPGCNTFYFFYFV